VVVSVLAEMESNDDRELRPSLEALEMVLCDSAKPELGTVFALTPGGNIMVVSKQRHESPSLKLV
jgi:hypothetical protein